MPNFDIIKETIPSKSFRTESIKGQFDLNIDVVKEQFTGNIDIENKEWSIGLIVGHSGTGKSTIAKHVFGKDYIEAYKYDKKSVLDNMPEGLSTEQITSTFNSVGFATVWSWLKPYHVLSNGEKMRVDIARAILSDHKQIVFDEFTSVVDRTVAKTASYAISKAIRKMGKKFVAVSCHSDIIEWLEPDWIYDTNTQQFFFCSGKYKKPLLEITIEECDKAEWKRFKKYHYLSTELNHTAKCYMGRIEGQPVCFFAVLHFPHARVKNFKRGHRLVVLPDFQGLGIGHKFSTEIAEMYKQNGFRFIITSSTKSLFKQRSKDKRWIVKSFGRKTKHSNLTEFESSGNKLTFSYEYIGDKKHKA